jgi:hypothetical protein
MPGSLSLAITRRTFTAFWRSFGGDFPPDRRPNSAACRFGWLCNLARFVAAEVEDAGIAACARAGVDGDLMPHEVLATEEQPVAWASVPGERVWVKKKNPAWPRYEAVIRDWERRTVTSRFERVALRS